MPTAVIVDAIRTPLGRRNGKLKDWHPVDLAAETLKALIDREQLQVTATPPAAAAASRGAILAEVGSGVLRIRGLARMLHSTPASTRASSTMW